MNSSLPGSTVHGIFQARILEWVAIPSPGHLPDPGIKDISLVAPALAGRFITTVPPGKLLFCIIHYENFQERGYTIHTVLYILSLETKT